MNKEEKYKGFTISWEEPPLSIDRWEANVGSGSPHLCALMGLHGSNYKEGLTRDEMIDKAKQYIDGMLG